ncbi:MAG: type II toxin-antitoxin system VapC family toxin [Acidobacteriota bacterium]
MTPSTKLVPDASVILKWVLDGADEPFRAEAESLLTGWMNGALDLLVPSLWAYEVGNILCLKRPQDAKEALSALRDLELREVVLDAISTAETIDLSVDHGVTFYDASYLAVARLNSATLVTADARFVRRLPTDSPVCLLEEYSG